MTQTLKASTTPAKNKKSKTSTPTTSSSSKQSFSTILQRAIHAPDSVSRGDLLALQSYTGNRALQRMLQSSSTDSGPSQGVSQNGGNHSLSHTTPFQESDSIVQRRPLAPTVRQTNAFRLHDKQQPFVQRLITRSQFERLAGRPSAKAQRKGIKENRSSTYVQILHKLEKVHVHQGNAKKKKTKLKELEKLIKSWLKKHLVDKNDHESGTKKSSDKRKLYFILGLQREVDNEIHNRTNASGQNEERLPSEWLRDWTETSDLGDQYSTETSQLITENKIQDSQNKNKYVFSVFAQIANHDDYEFMRKRLELTIANEKAKIKNKASFQHRVIKNRDDIRTEAVNTVIESKYKDSTNKQKADRRKLLEMNGGGGGHAWLKLSVFSPNNQLIKEYSFGFHPLVTTSFGIHLHAPGIVLSPDTVSEFYQIRNAIPDGKVDDDGNPTYDMSVEKGLRRLDTVISEDNFQETMEFLVDKLKNPPEYNAQTYNCSTFTKEAADMAGAPLPSNSYLEVPSLHMGKAIKGALKESLKMDNDTNTLVYSPTEIYHAMGSAGDHFHNEHISQYQDESSGYLPQYVPPVLLNPSTNEVSNVSDKQQVSAPPVKSDVALTDINDEGLQRVLGQKKFQDLRLTGSLTACDRFDSSSTITFSAGDTIQIEGFDMLDTTEVYIVSGSQMDGYSANLRDVARAIGLGT